MKRKVNGFTLLELLLVLALMGLLFSTITLPDLTKDPYEKAEKEALKISTLIDLVSEYAVLNNAIVGFAIKDNQYAFLFYDGERWVEIPEPPFNRVELEENYQLEIRLDDLEWQDQNMLASVEWIDEDELEELTKDADEEVFVFPQVFILPSGELSPFELIINYSDGFDIDLTFSVIGEFIAPVKMLTPEEREEFN